MAGPSITVPSFSNLPASTAKWLSITLREVFGVGSPQEQPDAPASNSPSYLGRKELVTNAQKVGIQLEGDQRLTLRPSCYMVPILKAPRGAIE
jgi:hypothetical protein